MDHEIELFSRILEHLERGALTQEDRLLLAGMVRARLASLQITSASPSNGKFEEAQLLLSLEQRIAEQEALRQVSLNLTASLDLETVLKAVLQGALRLIANVNDAHIFLYENDRLTFGSALWIDGQVNVPWTTPRPHGLTYTVARQGEIIHVADMSVHPLYENMNWTGAIIGIPLKIGSRVVGVMTTARKMPGEFSSDEIRLLQLLADHAAISIDNARQHNQAYLQAHHDPLTGLPNRRAMDERLQLECQHSLSSQIPFAFLMLDMDNFKEINDSYGHLVGDRVLRTIAKQLESAIRDKDFLARYGGDELALILPETTLDVATSIAHRLREVVANCDLGLPNHAHKRLSISIGLALFPLNARRRLDLIEAADQMLYQSKLTGRSGVYSFGSDQPPSKASSTGENQ
jgi:diguanylate cyclase (GGDEF)-like protein